MTPMPPHPKHDRANEPPKATPHAEKPSPAPMKLDPAQHRLVYSQPAADAGKWVKRGVTVAMKYEAQADPLGKPTVTMAAWQQAWKAAGALGVIREPSASPAADNADPFVLALLYVQDEPDNRVVEVSDNFVTDWNTNPPTVADKVGQAKAVEQVYSDAESWCAATRAAAPNKPIVVNLGLEQIRWAGKCDYARICKPFDLVAVDFYPVLRGDPIPLYGTLIDQLRAAVGDKVVIAFAECSNQNLDYGSRLGPTAVQFGQTVTMLAARKLCVGLFPQRIAGKGLDFAYDAMPTDLVAAYAAWAGVPAAPPVVVPPPAKGDAAPAMPDVLNVNGFIYDRRK